MLLHDLVFTIEHVVGVIESPVARYCITVRSMWMVLVTVVWSALACPVLFAHTRLDFVTVTIFAVANSGAKKQDMEQ